MNAFTTLAIVVIASILVGATAAVLRRAWGTQEVKNFLTFASLCALAMATAVFLGQRSKKL